jgi:hypothetical protein
MELDLYPINITEKMFKNKIMFNDPGTIKNESNIKNRSLDRLNEQEEQESSLKFQQILSLGNLVKSSD